MPPIELGTTRPVGAVDVRISRTAVGQAAARMRPEEKAVPAEPSALLDAGPAPVDAERVALVRKAVESGTYPVIPAKVADAIIAAGLLLRKQP